MNNSKNSTVIIQVICAVIFCTFSFFYLYFYQADILTATQHILSNGATHYNRAIGSFIIIVVLQLLQLTVFALSGLNKHTHALTYFPSFLVLTVLTSANFYQPDNILGLWKWIIIPLLVVYGGIIIVVKKFHSLESNKQSKNFCSPLIWTNLLILVVMCFLTGALSNSNSIQHYRAKIERHLEKRDYKEALLVGAKSPDTDASLVMLRAYALAKEGLLGERIFEYPLIGESTVLEPNKKGVSTLFYPQLEIQRFISGKAADDYRLCAYLLNKDLISFSSSVKQCYDLRSDTLPKHYCEALVLCNRKLYTKKTGYRNEVMEADFEDFQKLRAISNPYQRHSAIKKAYGNTYWYFFYYGRKE